MQQLFTRRIIYEGAANSLLASLTGAGLAVTLVIAAIILAAAVFAFISIVKRRHKKGGCHGCCGSCSSCGMRCSTDRDKNSSTAEKADKTFQESTIRTSTFSDLNKSGKQ